MESLRQQKVSRLLQKELSAAFQRESKEHFGGALITVTIVRVSSDFSVAKIYLSLFLAKDKNELLKKINERKWDLRKNLATTFKSQMRIVPELIFYIDDSYDYAARIDELLKK